MSDAASVAADTSDQAVPITRDGYSPATIDALAKRGLTVDDARRFGFRPVAHRGDLPDGFERIRYATDAVPGVLVPWQHAVNGEVIWQYRPDDPADNDAGDPVKYVFPLGVTPPVGIVREGTDPDGLVLIVEGTMQSRVAAKYADPSITVLSLSGCWNFSSGQVDGVPTELPLVDGREVVVILDADAERNHQVYSAGERLLATCKVDGAKRVRFVHIVAGGTTGLDDYLVTRSEPRRAKALASLIEHSVKDKPARSKPRPTVANTGSVFTDDKGRPLVEDLALAIIDPERGGTHALVTEGEANVAFYDDGVFRWTPDGMTDEVAKRLGNDHRASHVASVQQMAAQILRDTGWVERTPVEPIVCVGNGMLDLRDGSLSPHNPDYMATRKFAVHYDPDMPTPVYDAWVSELGLTGQIDDLEEVTSTMLDPTQRPNRALMLVGPSRSGKSTWARLMMHVVGDAFTSSVDLHDVGEDRFATANLAGMLLNISGDVSAKDLQDVSRFKKLTGEDPITANRKHGKQFVFTNRALWVITANKVPSVNESSNAYINRVKPFRFAVTFEGHEDPSIERALVAELPGILARWVAAFRRLRERGEYRPTDPEVWAHFVTGSNQVALWLSERATLYAGELAAAEGLDDSVKTMPDKLVTTPTEAFADYVKWCEENGRSRSQVARQEFLERIRNLEGVREVRTKVAKRRGFNFALTGGDGDQVARSTGPKLAQ